MGFCLLSTVFCLHHFHSMLELLIALFSLSLFIVLHHWSRRHVKGPKTWPLIGAVVELNHNYDRLHDWFADYLVEERTLDVPLPFVTYTLITDPANVEHVLKTNFSNYPKGDTFHCIMDELLGDGIFNSDGEMWRKQRKAASFEFASRNLREFSAVVFRDYAMKLCTILSHVSYNNLEMDMQDLLMRMTLDSICKVGFGTDVGTLDPTLPENSFAKAFDTANCLTSFRFADPLWKLKRFLNVGSEARLRRSMKVINDFSYSVIQKRQAEAEAATATMRSDILSRFIELSKDLENNMSQKNLRDAVINFIIAGRDTSAAGLSWTVYMVMTHDHVAEKILDELRAFEDEKAKEENVALPHPEMEDEESFNQRLTCFAQFLTCESLGRLQYLQAVISETLRLYPPVPLDPKGIVNDDVLPDGKQVRAGNVLFYSPYVMGRMEHVWGADATVFNPERWIKDGVCQHESPFKFCAFQAGPRICLGKESAYLQMKMTLALLCRFFKFHLAPDHKVKYVTANILAMKDGLKVSVSRRPLV